ncbi:MAG: hypothetical protein R2991_00255 [Thermoanaerobaculia bacterium]
MRKKSRQAGEGLAGCLFWLAILGIIVLIGFKVVPVKMNASQLYDFMVEQAKFSSNSSADLIKRRILGKAREFGLPVTSKNVSVVKAGGRIRMRCRFTVPVDLYVYTYNWEFDYEVDRPVFII